MKNSLIFGRFGAESTHVSYLQLNDIVAVDYKKFCAVSSLLKKPRRVDDGIPPLGPRQSLCSAKVPGGRCPAGSAGRTATGSPSPQQPPVVVVSNPDTLITNKPRTLSGTGLVRQGWTMGFEPTTTGTTIRGSTAELRPPFQREVAGRIIHRKMQIARQI